MSFDVSLVIDSLPRILEGIGLTLQLLVLSTIFGFIIAVILLLMRISGKWLPKLGKARRHICGIRI